MPKSKEAGLEFAKPEWNKHIGALSELAATKYLLMHGYEVFRNISQHGLADIVAWKPGQSPLLIDVKTAVFSERGGKTYLNLRKPTPEQVKAGVRILHVCRNTGAVGFDVSEFIAASGVTVEMGANGGVLLLATAGRPACGEARA